MCARGAHIPGEGGRIFRLLQQSVTPSPQPSPQRGEGVLASLVAPLWISLAEAPTRRIEVRFRGLTFAGCRNMIEGPPHYTLNLDTVGE